MLRQSASRSAFTLIEVLVVVAIMALLVAILLPALSQARAQSRTVVCDSHIHQFGVGMNVFAAEHKARAPRGASNQTRFTWVQWMARMMGDKKSYSENYNRVPVERWEVFQCPERTIRHGGPFLDYAINGMDHRGPLDNGGRFSPTGRWIGVKGFTKVEAWKRPSETLYVAEAADENKENMDGILGNTRERIAAIRAAAGITSNTGWQVYESWAGYTLPSYAEDITIDGRQPRIALMMHSSGSNGVYVDGHTASQRPPKRTSAIFISQFYMRRFGVLNAFKDNITSLAGTHPNQEYGLGDESYVPY